MLPLRHCRGHSRRWPGDADRFEEWREQVEPVFIYTHRGEWIAGSVARYGYDIPHGSVALLAEGIESGTSGSPVVTADGLLLGIVSNSSAAHSASEPCGTMPVCVMALPCWVLDRINGENRNVT